MVSDKQWQNCIIKGPLPVMGLFSRGKTPAGEIVAEHSVVVRFALDASPGGTATDIGSLARLEANLEHAIRLGRAGEFDGSELGQGEVFLYAYGQNADRLFAAMEPVLRRFPARPRKALLRYGPASDPHVREMIVDF